MATALKDRALQPALSPSSRLRIGFLAGDMSLGGGVNRVICDLASLFAKELGAEVTVVSVGSRAAPAYPISPKVAVYLQKGAGLWSNIKAVLHFRRSGADFLIGSWTQDNFLLILACLVSRCRAIIVEHTSWYFHPPRVRALRRLLYPLAANVIVLNPAELAYYRRFLTSVRLVPNPVALVPNANDICREKLIVAIGHLEPRKNFRDAVLAMAMSGLEMGGWSLAIIGSGPDQAELEALIAEAGLKNTTIHAPTADIQCWYRRASMILVPSTLEVFSLVLVESMSAGVIPVAYAADGPAYLLEDFPDHLVAIGNVDALTERLVHFARLGDQPELRDSLIESVRRRFSPDVVLEHWRAMIDPQPAATEQR